MPKRKFILALALFLLSLGLRLFFLSKGPFHTDVLELAINSRATLETLKLHYQHGAGYPLNVILGSINIALLSKLGISDVIALNFSTAVFSSGAVIIFFFIVKNIISERAAFVSSILFSVFPAYLSISTFALNHAPSIFFALSAIYFMLAFSKKMLLRDLKLSGLSLGLCAATRLPDILIFFPVIYIYLIATLSSKEKRTAGLSDLKRLSIFFLFLTVPILLFYLPMLLTKGIEPILATSRDINMGQFLWFNAEQMKKAFGYMLAMLKQPFFVISLAGLLMLWKKNRRNFIILTLWFLPLFFLNANISTLAPRFLIISLIPFLISGGYFFEITFNFKNRALTYIANILLILIALQMLVSIVPVLDFRHRHALGPDYAKWVGKMVDKKSKIIAIDEKLFLNYFAKLDVISRPVTCEPQEIRNFLKQAVDKNIRDGFKVYIIDTGLYTYDECGEFKNILFGNYSIKFIGGHINEDWHRKSYRLGLFNEGLYEIIPKNNS